jgi:hypothetical protein
MSGSTNAYTPRAPAGVGRAAGAGTGTAHGSLSPVTIPGMSGAPVPVLPLHYRETVMATEWPLRDFIELGPLPGAVPCARLHARQLLWEWGLTRLTNDAELLVSELVTNGVRASRDMGAGMPVGLWLLADWATVLILVWDASRRLPEAVYTAADAEGGRGLMLVEAISTRWDWYFPRGMGGKVVWAEIRAEFPADTTSRSVR